MSSQLIAHIEPFDQGLVTSKDPALLQPGELVLASNTVYRPNDPSIQKTKGRTKFNAAAITGTPDVKGLRYLAFDDASNILVALTGTTYWSALMANSETGTFSSLATGIGSGLSLDAAQYNNRQYLFNGAGSVNVVVRSDLTTRNHGLSAVIDPPVVTTVGGSWNTTLGAGYYFFFTVEIINPGNTGSPDEIESSNYVPDSIVPSYQFTTTTLTTTSIFVTKPTTINSTATHWAVYMAGPTTANQPVPPRSSFRRVGSPQDISTTTLTIGNTNITGTNSRFPTANTALVAGGWASPANANANDNAYTAADTLAQATVWRTFGFTGLTGTIVGITVEVKFYVPPVTFFFTPPKVGCALTSDLAAYTTEQQVQTTTSGAYIFTFGGTTNMWGRAWALGDLNSNASFGVRLAYRSTGPGERHLLVGVDYIKVTAHSIGASATTQIFQGQFFPTIAVSVAGITSVIGSHGLPPVASTADIFEDQLATNDITDPSILRYSLPTQVDYFPTLYLVNFETKETDILTCVRRLGDKLLVGMKTQLFRVNYLPRESDAEFDRGRCYETISEGQGIVGTQAFTVFTSPGGPLLGAFVSYSGLHVTDGFQVDTLSDDLDWPNTVSIPTAASPTDYLQNCILVDYPQLYWLVLYYTPTGGTSNTKALVFHYHPSQRKANGKFKITGPIAVAALSACIARVSNSPCLVTGQSGGFVYVEDRGYTHNAGGTLAVDVKTREIYPWGMTETGTVEQVHFRHNQDATSTVTVTPIFREGDDATTTGSPETFTTANAGVASIPMHLYSDSIQFQLTEPGADGGAGVRLAAMMVDCFTRGGSEAP